MDPIRWRVTFSAPGLDDIEVEYLRSESFLMHEAVFNSTRHGIDTRIEWL